MTRRAAKRPDLPRVARLSPDPSQGQTGPRRAMVVHDWRVVNQTSPVASPTAWRPGWAAVIAWLGLVACLALAGYAAWLVYVGTTTTAGSRFGLGLTIGLGLLAVVAGATWAFVYFLRGGGPVSLALGVGLLLCLVAISALSW